MSKHSYAYVDIPLPATDAHPNGSVAHRPLMIATITALNGESIRWLVLPDSGADACLFPLSMAIMLKIDVLRLPKAQTVGVGSQNNTTYYDTLTIGLDNGIQFSAYCGFTRGMDSVGLGLLGQSGFFDSYNVEFRHAQKTFTIETL